MPAKHPPFLLLTITVLFALVAGLSVACSTVSTEPPASPTPTSPIPVVTPVPPELRATQRAQPVTTRVRTPSPTPYIISPTTPRPTRVVVIIPSAIPTLQVIALPTPHVITLPPTITAISPLPTIRVVVAALPTISPLPTLPLLPTPIPALRPLPTPVPAPTSVFIPPPATTSPRTVVTSVEIAEFARSCQQIRDSDEPDFDRWVADAQDLKAPSGLTDYWDAYVNQFALQDEAGPNAASQEANVRAMEAVVAMLPGIRDSLLDAGCLHETDVWVSRETVAARDRLEGGYAQGGTVTVEQFAEACSDIKFTAPLVDAPGAVPEHFAYWWARLVPPPGMEEYYAAVMDFYREWLAVGDLEQVDILVERAVTEAAMAFDGDTMDTLLRTRCFQ